MGREAVISRKSVYILAFPSWKLPVLTQAMSLPVRIWMWVIFECTFNPSTPKMTWMPASCIFFDQLMFDASSKRASSSMTTVTFLPLRAAQIRACTTFDSLARR